MNSYILLPLIQTLFCLVLIAVVLRGHFRSFTHRLFCLFLLGLATWGFVIFGMRASPDVEHAYSWERWLIPLGVSVAVIFYHFSVQYTAVKIKRRLLYFLYLICLLFIPLAMTRLFISGMQIKSYGYAPIYTSVGVLWILLAGGLCIMALRNFARAYRTSPYDEEQNRAAYIIIGIAFIVIGGVFDVLPLLGLPLYPGLIIGTIVFCLLTTVAIVRYNLLDIRIVLRKSTAYFLMSALIALPFIGIFLLVTHLFAEVSFPLWAYFVLLVALAFALPKLWQWVQQRVDRWFYRDRYDYLKALEQFSREAQNVVNLKELSSTLTRLVSGALHTSSTCLLLPSESDNGLIVVSSTGLDSPPPGVVLRNNSLLIKWLKLQQHVLSSEEFNIVPQLQSLSLREKNNLEQIEAKLYVPLSTAPGQLSGILVLGQKLSQQPYSSEDRQLLTALSNQMAMALENARLYAASQQEVAERKRTEEELRQSHEQLRNLSAHIESVTETERTSIAREVHDELGQALTAIKMDLSWLNKRLPKEQEAIIKKTGEMSRLIGTTIQMVKRISTKLRPGVLDDLGLMAAIEWQVQEFQERTRIKCELPAEGEDINLDRDLATAVFRILQEALTNVARHANATRVEVNLKEGDGQLVLQVRDNGKGITEKQIAHPKSFGLIGMRERARSWNGSIKIHGISGKGTTVTVSLPLNRKEERDDKNTSR